MGISIWQLLIVLAIIVLLFGTKKLRNVGADLGGAIKSFRKAVKEGEDETQGPQERLEEKEKEQGTVIDVEATEEKDKA